MFKFIFLDGWKYISFIWQPIFFFLAFFIYCWHLKSFPTCLWEGNTSLVSQRLRHKNMVSYLCCTRPLPMWNKYLNIFRSFFCNMPGAIEKRNVIYDAWKILNIYCNKERGKKKEWCLFYMDFITKKCFPLQSHYGALFLEVWIGGRWEQMCLSAFWTMTTEKCICYYQQKPY